MFSIKKDTLRRGEYRNYTFRMPAHVPELTFSIVAERGCVCFYASNCSERPTPDVPVDAARRRGEAGRAAHRPHERAPLFIGRLSRWPLLHRE